MYTHTCLQVVDELFQEKDMTKKRSWQARSFSPIPHQTIGPGLRPVYYIIVYHNILYVVYSMILYDVKPYYTISC